MTPYEWWLEFDTKIEVSKRISGNTLGASGISKADWEDARRRHSEKMRAKNG